MNFLAQRRSNFLLKQDKSNTQVRTESTNAPAINVSRLSGIGSWKIDFIEKTTHFDAQTRKLLQIPTDFRPSLHKLDQFYFEEFREKAVQVFYECREGNSFSVISKMKNYQKRELWGKITGEPIYNEKRQVIGILGIFQDVTAEKEQELQLKQTIAQLKNQNGSLQNFAKITSHNLRSLANNLQLSLELLHGSDSVEEQSELLNGMSQISENFNTTIHHLNKVLAIQGKARGEKEPVVLKEVLESVLHLEHDLILETDTEVYSDFSELPVVPHLTEFMEFVIRELLVNAITYRSPNRKPEINIYSSIENDKKLLTIKDNGLGIDMSKHEARLFHLYQTFHDRPEASGVGLFLVRNKIEAMLGAISVKSEVDKGTTFQIEF
ncbi:MAG: hypothetical protein CMC08_04320 [Flavobacteriaceae bacterium]|nr:hypothetical protein [Flavobacteriaceae bacterium]